MKSNAEKFALMLILITALMSACGNMELGIMPAEPADAGLGVPEGVIIAREITLMHLRDAYGNAAPAEGLQWQADYVGESYPVGMGAYKYTSSSWVISIEYPVVAPEATVYTVEVIDGDSDFHWSGQVNARGDIVELDATTAFPTEETVQPTEGAGDRGWETYVNERYGYEISFPPEAELEEMGVQGYPSDENGNPVGDIPQDLEPDEVIEYLRERYGDNLCTQIRIYLGYITISVPENEQFRYAVCGRTGVGVAELIPKEETIKIDGMEIIASGHEIIAGGDALPEHNESFRLMLPDGTVISYGALPNESATYQDYLNQAKPIIMEILSTYRSR